MNYKNDTFLFLLQEVSLKYHKSSMKYHKNNLLTIFHDIAQKPSHTLALNARGYGQQVPSTWAIDAHHVVSECPPNGHRETNQWADFSWFQYDFSWFQ